MIGKHKRVISEIPLTAVDIYRILPEGTRCEVIFNELVFLDYIIGQPIPKNFIAEIPTTALEVYQMLPEGTRCEVIFNELVMSPSPSREYQLVLIKLTHLLFQFLENHKTGMLLTAPFDIYFEQELAVVHPDLFIVLNQDSKIIKKRGVYGVPPVVIEIISTNHTYDTKRKRALYEKAGVKEYFMIDPENKNTILLTLNTSGKYDQCMKKQAC